MNLHIYFGCALAYGPEDYKQEISLCKKKLSSLPWITLFDFCTPLPGQKQSDLSPADIYETDIIVGVGSAHVVLGDLSYPSTGLGAELGIALREHRVRTMMFARKKILNDKQEEVENVVSKLWIGAPVHNPHASFEWYEKNIEEVFEKIVLELEKEHQKIQ